MPDDLHTQCRFCSRKESRGSCYKLRKRAAAISGCSGCGRPTRPRPFWHLLIIWSHRTLLTVQTKTEALASHIMRCRASRSPHKSSAATLGVSSFTDRMMRMRLPLVLRQRDVQNNDAGEHDTQQKAREHTPVRHGFRERVQSLTPNRQILSEKMNQNMHAEQRT
jgi:hypothetical protein